MGEEERKIAKLTKSFNSKFKAQHDVSTKAQAQASLNSSRTKKLRASMRKEEKILKAEQAKARQERLAWKKALESAKRERIAQRRAQGALSQSSKAETARAQLQIKKAQDLAKSKDKLLLALKKQLKGESRKFSKATKDWRRVRLSLEAHAKQAESEAAEAQRKLAKYARRHQKSAIHAAAKNEVKKVIAKTDTHKQSTADQEIQFIEKLEDDSDTAGW